MEILFPAKIPKPKDSDAEKEGEQAEEVQQTLPQTLVRIPIQQAEAAQREEEKREARSGV